MRKAVYPGSFDPLTNGHLDIIKRAACHFDELHIVVADNVNKKSFFSVEERINMLKLVTTDIPNLVITYTDQLIVRYAKDNNINVLIRGLRNILDYTHEYQLFSFNHNLESTIETFVMFPSKNMHFVSSSAIKELIYHNADISAYVPELLVPLIIKKFELKFK